MPVKNTASALGEAVGKLIEDEIERTLSPICREHRCVYDRGGKRPKKRKGVLLVMVNTSGNRYQLDGVVENPNGEPVILLESKYLRYKKHNRDKGSWTCASHYSLRKTYPTIRKSIALLSGRWSVPSKAFLESFGIELHHIDFALMCSIMADYGVPFDWPEHNQKIPDKAWSKFQALTAGRKKAIGRKLVDPIRDALASSIRTTLEGGEDWPQHLNEVELLLKTDRNEYFTQSFTQAKDAIEFLLSLHEEAQDLRGKLSKPKRSSR